MAKSRSNTRCKPGDIAIFVRGLNIGKLVHIERKFNDEEVIGNTRWVRTTPGPVWVVSSLSGPLVSRLVDYTVDPKIHLTIAVEEVALRPLRNPRGRDQTLSWSTVPQIRGVENV